MITTKVIFPTLIDIFYGNEGFDPKETVRMKRINSNWRIVNMPQVFHIDEIDYGKITSLWTILPEINEYLQEHHNGKAPRSPKK